MVPFQFNFLNVRRLQEDFDEIEKFAQSDLNSSAIQEKAYQMGLDHALAFNMDALKLQLKEAVSPINNEELTKAAPVGSPNSQVDIALNGSRDSETSLSIPKNGMFHFSFMLLPRISLCWQCHHSSVQSKPEETTIEQCHSTIG